MHLQRNLFKAAAPKQPLKEPACDSASNIPFTAHVPPEKIMPLNIAVGVSRKVGLPDYGSRGASCHVEFEADNGLLLHDVEGFHEAVRAAYAACRQAVDEQVAPQAEDAARQDRSNGREGRPSGNGARRSSRPRRATESQVRAIYAIAKRQELNLPAELRDRYGVDRPDELSISEASELIDAIKPEANGQGGRR